MSGEVLKISKRYSQPNLSYWRKTNRGPFAQTWVIDEKPTGGPLPPPSGRGLIHCMTKSTGSCLNPCPTSKCWSCVEIECPLSIRWPKSICGALCHTGVQLSKLTAPIHNQCEGDGINCDKPKSNENMSIQNAKRYTYNPCIFVSRSSPLPSHSPTLSSPYWTRLPVTRDTWSGESRRYPTGTVLDRQLHCPEAAVELVSSSRKIVYDAG